MLEMLIIIVTGILIVQGDILYDNLTIIANTPTYRLFCCLYFILSLLYLGYRTYQVSRRYVKGYKLMLLILCDGILLMSSLCLPYNEKRHDWLSSLHVSGAFYGFVLYGCIWMIILYHMSMKDMAMFNRCRTILITTITATCISMFSTGNINSLSEIIIVIGTCLLEYTILHKQA